MNHHNHRESSIENPASSIDVSFEPLYFGNLYLFRISNFGFRVYARYASQFTLHENEIQSTNYYVRNYQRIMQNKPNLVRRSRIAK
jgi:hypothetical protein